MSVFQQAYKNVYTRNVKKRNGKIFEVVNKQFCPSCSINILSLGRTEELLPILEITIFSKVIK